MSRTPLAVLALLLLLTTTTTEAASRRRAVQVPSNPEGLVSHDPSTIQGWLQIHGYTLSTTEYFSPRRALAAQDRLIAASSRQDFLAALYNSTVPIGWSAQGVGFRDQFMRQRGVYID